MLYFISSTVAVLFSSAILSNSLTGIPLYIHAENTALSNKLEYINPIIRNTVWDAFSLQEKIYLQNTGKKAGKFHTLELKKTESAFDMGLFLKKRNRDTYLKEFSEKEIHVSFYSYQKSKSIRIHFLMLYDQAILFEKIYKTSKRRLNYSLRKLTADIRSLMCPRKCSRILLQSYPQEASVYLRGIYIGNTPLRIANLPFGKYEVELHKKDFETLKETIVLPKNKSPKQRQVIKRFRLTEEKARASLSVKTSPVSAKLYVNGKYLGMTPFTLNAIPDGIYKITAAADGYYSEKKIVEILNEESKSIYLELLSSDQKKVPYNHFWGPITYEHLYWGSFISGIGLLTTGIYFSIQASQAKERLIASLGSQNLNNLSAEDQKKVADSRTIMQSHSRTANIFYAVGGVFIGLSIYLFFKNLYHEGGFSYTKTSLNQNIFVWLPVAELFSKRPLTGNYGIYYRYNFD